MEQIVAHLNVSPSRVNHHIRNRIEGRLVYRRKQKIYIRGSSLCTLVKELRKDTPRVLDDVELAATDVDESFGILNR